MAPKNEKHYSEIDSITSLWEQGDYALGSFEFLYRANPSHHVASTEELDKNEDVIIQEIEGFCIVSQTCDIVRDCKDRPYLEIVPIVKLNESDFEEAAKGGRPNYGYIPTLKDQKLVADLDRVMTMEKSCLKDVEKISGCKLDQERRLFAKALARKRLRFAFPDDFNRLASKLRKRIVDKHGKKESEEGKALRSLKEIRVSALPEWNAQEVDLHFYFIRHPGQAQFEGKSWNDYRDAWMTNLKENEKYKNISGEVTTMDTMSAQEYVDSDQLDLDHLSGF